MPSHCSENNGSDAVIDMKLVVESNDF